MDALQTKWATLTTKALEFLRDPENKSIVVALSSSVVVAGVLAVVYSNSSSSSTVTTLTNQTTNNTTTFNNTTTNKDNISHDNTPLNINTENESLAKLTTVDNNSNNGGTPVKAAGVPLSSLATPKSTSAVKTNSSSSRRKKKSRSPLVVSPPKSVLKKDGKIPTETISFFLTQCKAQLDSETSRAQVSSAMKDEHLSYSEAIQKHIKSEQWKSLNIDPQYGERTLLKVYKRSKFHDDYKNLKIAEKEAKPYVLLNPENVPKWNNYKTKKSDFKKQYRNDWATKIKNRESMQEIVQQARTKYAELSKKTEGKKDADKMLIRCNFNDDEIRVMARIELIRDYSDEAKSRNSGRTPRSVLKQRNTPNQIR
jgi:hypothetical protein